MLRAFVIVAVFLAGCAGPTPQPPTSPTSDYDAALDRWQEARQAEGRALYDRACATCHDPGAGPAPDIGRPEDWDGRSGLWTAVLTRHAREGYLAMPARGGYAALTDRQVAAATEYMLTVTYPELPAD